MILLFEPFVDQTNLDKLGSFTKNKDVHNHIFKGKENILEW